MRPLRRAIPLAAEAPGFLFSLDDGWRCRVALPHRGFGRVTLLPPDGYREPRTWAIAPSFGGRTHESPWEGRSRDDPAGFAVPGLRVVQRADSVVLESDDVRATVSVEPFGVRWEVRAGGSWVEACADRTTYAYAVSTRGTRIVHGVRRDAHDRYYGLGDKTGAVEKTGRRLRTLQLDALGYDAEIGDPLYKHWPFFVGRRADTGACYGVYYDTLSEATFDFGQEHDNYHGLYRSTEIADGDLDVWFIAGPDLASVIRRFLELTGPTAFPPRWTLGYANTAMSLTDAPDAQARIADFLERAHAERIPLSSFHFGSGYSSRGKRRYVFTWNVAKFPDPQALTQRFHSAGVRIVANIKPCLLDDHPAFAEVAAAGGFVANGTTGSPCLGQFWDGWGAHVDFTHARGIEWWQQGVERRLLDAGIDVGWNDNNEYEIWDEDAVAHGFGSPIPFARARPLQALLMTRATAEAQQRRRAADAMPQGERAERLYTITRAGPPGIQRYAQTWTGDNTTSWHTLRWNQRMALTMGLSGLFDTGHDVGGFAGPVPDPELLVRWTQACALNPRFIMNSWKDDGTVNTPWLHPAVTPIVRAAIELRLSLLPYLYTQRWLASTEHVPFLRPTFFEFPDDPTSWNENDEMMVGPDLLIAPVFEPAAQARTLYLPRDASTPGWFELDTGRWHASGAVVTVDAPQDRLPIFVRAGAVLPVLGTRDCTRRTDEPSRALRCFPVPRDVAGGPRRVGRWFEDDGRSDAWKDGVYALMDLDLDGDDQGLALVVRRTAGSAPFDPGPVSVILPPSERREVSCRGDDAGLSIRVA